MRWGPVAIVFTMTLALAPVAPAQVTTPPVPPVAPDDTVVFVRNNDLYAVSGDGKGLRQLTTTPDRELGLAPAPDGSAVAYEAFDTQRNEFAVYVLPIEGGVARRVLPVGHSPSWSPDGGRLLYTINVRGGYDVFLCHRDGTAPQRLTDTPGSELYPVWAPDGTRIAYLRDLQDGQQRSQALVVRDALGAETVITTLVGQQVTKMAWAPGANLLISSRTTDASTRDALHEVKPEAGSKPRQLTEGLDNELCGSWLPSGLGLLATQVGRNVSRPILRLLAGGARPLPGLDTGDADPCLVPGPGSRAPQVYVGGRRSFYLPTAQVAEDDVLLPLGELARQLGWQVTAEGADLKLAKGQLTRLLTTADGSLRVGETVLRLSPAPRLLAGALLVPARALAEALEARCEWNPQARVLRLTAKEVPNAPSGRPQG